MSKKNQNQTATGNEIAIIGMDGRFPGASSVRHYFENLKKGKESITFLTDEELRQAGVEESLIQDPQYIKAAFLLDDIEKFDASFFNISPRDAQIMDPQQRLLMECAWATFENAGYVPDQLASDVGMFCGSGGSVSSYLLECFQHDSAIRGETGSLEHLGNDKDFVGTKISYKLNITGPSINVQTACSTTAVAVHMACQSILNGECDMALAGGVTVRVPHRVGYILKKGSIFSHDGHVRPFDANAQGMVFGSGLGLVLLKPLAQAIQDHDQIYAVIKGSAINNDGGRKMSYMAASAKGQVRCMQKAFEAARVSPDTISYVETHGTGTVMGDPVEVTALTQAFQTAEQTKKQYCGLGSVKSNIGHTDIVSGIASLIKTVMCLHHKTLVPSINFVTANPKIDFQQSPFYVNTELQPWEINGPRRACVNSLGIGGTNAFLILEEPPERGISAEDEKMPAYLIPLSAKTEDALQRKVNELSAWLDAADEAPSIRDIAHTLQSGRSHFSYRFACLANNCQDLKSKIAEFSRGSLCDDAIMFDPSLPTISNEDKEGYERIISTLENSDLKSKKRYHEDLLQIAKAYVRGYEVDWSRLANRETVYKVALPTYPFSPDSHWVQEEKRVSERKPIPNKHLHPLLQENRSDFSQQTYTSTFTGEEFFLKDHQVRGQKVLPSVAYLEMAYEAVRNATNGSVEEYGHTVRFKNVVWARPIVARGAIDVHIGLSQAENGEIHFDVYTDAQDKKGEAVVHSQGVAMLSPADHHRQVPIDDLQKRLDKATYHSQECYDLLTRIGFNYGPAHQGMKQIYVGTDPQGFPEVLAKLELPAVVSQTLDSFTLHPSLLDSALQSSLGISLASERPNDHGDGKLPRLSLPFALEEMEVVGNCTKTMWAWVRVTDRERGSIDSEMDQASARRERSSRVQKLDVRLCDEKGNLCAKLTGYSSRRISEELSKREQAVGRMMFSRVWKEKSGPLPEAERNSIAFMNHFVFLCGMDAKSRDLQSKIPHGGNPEITFVDLDSNLDVLERRFERFSLQLFEHIQDVFKGKMKEEVLLQVVVPNQGAEAIFSGLSGLLKTAHIENPKMLGQVIAVEKDEAPEGLIAKLNENSKNPQDQQIRYEGERRLVASVAEVPCPKIIAEGDAQPPWKEGGVYLITGGTGGLGMIFAREIVSQVKSATVILTGRSTLTEEKKASIRSLERASVTIAYESVDVSDKEGVERLVEKIQNEHGGLNGIIHCAGVIRDNFILKKTSEEFRQVLAPKVAGTVNLDEATKKVGIDFFILFASRSGIFGNDGQADYSAANAFMDGFAEYRHSLGSQRPGKTLSIDWPLWKEGGMSVAESLERRIYQVSGEKPMPADVGVEAMKSALSRQDTQAIVMYGDLGRIRERMSQGPDLTLNKTRDGAAAAETSLVATETVQAYVVEYLKNLLSETLKLSKDKLESNVNFEKYGMDSIIQMPFLKKLETITGSLPKTLLFEYVNIDELAEHLIEEHTAAFEASMRVGGRDERTAGREEVGEDRAPELEYESTKLLRRGQRSLDLGDKGQDALANSELGNQSDIAIIGLAGRYPESPDLDVFWENLREGRNCITEAPKDRFLGLGKQFNYDRPVFGGFISGIDHFDHERFEISAEESRKISPEQRLFLETVSTAIRDSGYSKESLGAYQKQLAVGVYVGTMYSQSQYSQDSLEAAMLSSNSHDWEIANRISHYYDLSGPSIALSTACSSSISAIYLACQALHSREVGMAIAGGVNLTLNASKFKALEIAGYLENGNRSKPFGDGSGYVPGEGVGVVMLKPLRNAILDGDRIHGVIKSCCVNHTGGRQLYATPDPVMQGELIGKALEKSGVDFESIQYIEAASNGSPLGDPIEIVALKRAFKGFSGNGKSRAMGTVKSNIGHLEAASGISQLTKVLLQMKHKKLVPSIHAEPLNSEINLGNTSFKVQKQLEDWEKGVLDDGINGTHAVPRRALLNSFGAGGACASMVIEEYDHQMEKGKSSGIQKQGDENSAEKNESKPAAQLLYQDLFAKLRNKSITKEEIASKLYEQYAGISEK
jgi:acyl transferase domain-containing protein